MHELKYRAYMLFVYLILLLLVCPLGATESEEISLETWRNDQEKISTALYPVDTGQGLKEAKQKVLLEQGKKLIGLVGQRGEFCKYWSNKKLRMKRRQEAKNAQEDLPKQYTQVTPNLLESELDLKDDLGFQATNRRALGWKGVDMPLHLLLGPSTGSKYISFD